MQLIRNGWESLGLTRIESLISETSTSYLIFHKHTSSDLSPRAFNSLGREERPLWPAGREDASRAGPWWGPKAFPAVQGVSRVVVVIV